MLELGGSILIEFLLSDAIGQTKGIPEAHGLQHTKLVLEAHLQRAAGGDTARGGESCTSQREKSATKSK